MRGCDTSVHNVAAADSATVCNLTLVAAMSRKSPSTKHNGFPVVNKDGVLTGLISLRLLADGKFDVPVSDFMDCSPISVRPTDSLGRTLRIFCRMGCRHLPVVDENFFPVGIVTRRDLLPWSIAAKMESEIDKSMDNGKSLDSFGSFGSGDFAARIAKSKKARMAKSPKKKEFDKRRR